MDKKIITPMSQEKLKILHCLCRIGSGGVEQRRVLLADGLAKDCFEHVVICQEAFGALPKMLRDAGWKIHEIGLAPHILSPTWHNRAFSIAREFKPDIIHGAVYEGVALANIIGLRMPRVKVISEETSDPVNRRWKGNLLMRGLCLRSDAVIGVSPTVVEYLKTKLQISQRKLRLVNNAVSELPPPETAVLQSLSKTLGINPGELVLGTVGRVQDDHKRFSDIILAMPTILKLHPQARLLIIGDGPDRLSLEDLAKNQGVKHAVVFAGYQGDIRAYYHLMDLFVLASAHEAFGLVLVEAMFAGVGIVATAVGGIPFVLDQGRCGTLVPPYRPDELARAINELLSQPLKRAQIAQAGLVRAKAEFAAERYVNDVVSLYMELTSETRRAI